MDSLLDFFFFFGGEGEWVSSHYCFKYISHQTPEMFSTDNLTLSGIQVFVLPSVYFFLNDRFQMEENDGNRKKMIVLT